MIELFLKAIDRLIDLIRISEKRGKARYDEIYKPSFSELQSVHTDYLAVISEFATKLNKIPEGATKDTEAAADALAFLRQRRLALAPVREKLWAFRALQDEGYASEMPEVETDFLWSLVRYFEATEIIQNEHTTYATDLIDKLENALSPTFPELEGDEAEEFFDTAGRYTLSEVRLKCENVLSCLGTSWQDACEKYNKLRLNLTRHTS